MNDEKPDDSAILTCLTMDYGLHTDDPEYVTAGDEGHVWRVRDHRGSALCVKWYRRHEHSEVERRAELTDGLRQDGLPFPRVYLTAAGRYAASLQDHPVEVYEWIDGEGLLTLSPDTARVAGAVLGRVHQSFRLKDESATTAWVKRSWIPCHVVRSETMAILDRIRALPQKSALDCRIHDTLVQRLTLMNEADAIYPIMPELAQQTVHGDYTRGNLMFRRGALIGVIDMIGPVGSPVWEVARIAFEPQTVVERPDWLEVGAAAVQGYQSVCDLNQVSAVVKVGALYHLSSSWGLLDRYRDTGEVVATDNEGYWLNRQETARLLLEHLPEVERRVIDAA